jgi:hypothetical protein
MNLDQQNISLLGTLYDNAHALFLQFYSELQSKSIPTLKLGELEEGPCQFRLVFLGLPYCVRHTFGVDAAHRFVATIELMKVDDDSKLTPVKKCFVQKDGTVFFDAATKMSPGIPSNANVVFYDLVGDSIPRILAP